MIADAARRGDLRLSTISVWEISFLATWGKIELGTTPAAWIAQTQARSRITLEPLTVEIAAEAGSLPGGFRSDPADQIIVATARVIGATLLTRDQRILDYAAAGHVNAVAA
jgi:PIN domain nuclease of toxin-antitoxin system